MNWLPWLTPVQRTQLRSRITKTVTNEIYSRHWGAPAPGGSPGGGSRFYIMDIRGLFMAAGILRYTLGQFGTRVLYRGQRKDWEAQCSLFRGAQRRADIVERQEWLEKVIVAARPMFDPNGTDNEREALLQHYGFPTRWLDVVDNVQTAAWFACHQPSAATAASPGSRDASSGYISAIAIPVAGAQYATALDLRSKPSEWLRPHIQQAWGVRLVQKYPKLMPMSFLQVCTFIVPTALLEQWSAYGVLSHAVMFPTEQEDRGRYYARCAHKKITDEGLLPAPWSA